MECSGCLEDQPNQLAHMHPGGCLYQESDSEDETDNESVDLGPKRPCGPFIMWLNETKEIIISKYFSDHEYGYYELGRAISKKGSKLWKSLKKEDRDIYNNKYRSEYKKWKCEYILWKNERLKNDKLLELENYTREIDDINNDIKLLEEKKLNVYLRINSVKRHIEILDENDSNNIKVLESNIFNVDSILCGC